MGRHEEEGTEVRKEKKEKSKHKHKDKDKERDKSSKYKDKSISDGTVAKAEPEQNGDTSNGFPLPPRSGEKSDRQPREKSRDKESEVDKESRRDRDSRRERDGDKDREKDRHRHRDRDRDREEGSKKGEKERRRDRDDDRDKEERRRHDKDRDRDRKKVDRKEDDHRSERRDKEEHSRGEKAADADKDDRGKAAAKPSVAADPEGDFMEEDLPGPPSGPIPVPEEAAAASSVPEELFVLDVKPQVQESGGEISMSIEETNRSVCHPCASCNLVHRCQSNAFLCLHSAASAASGHALRAYGEFFIGRMFLY